jgi:hypothetical protein
VRFVGAEYEVAVPCGCSSVGTRMRDRLSDADIRAAVQLWCSNEGDAIDRYGPISDWDTCAVTDMCEMVQGAVEFNGDISEWNVSAAVLPLWLWSVDWCLGEKFVCRI